MAFNSTSFAIHWISSDEQVSASYSKMIKSITEYCRIVADLYPTHSFSISFNKSVVVSNENFCNYKKITESLTNFFPHPTTAPIQNTIFPLLSEEPTRLVILTNAKELDWSQINFDLEYFQLQSVQAQSRLISEKNSKSIKLPQEVFVIHSLVNCTNPEYIVFSKCKPTCHGISCDEQNIEDSLRKAAFLLNDLNVIRIANVPMKKRVDSERKAYDVLFVAKRDEHIIGPSMKEFFERSFEFLLQNRQMVFSWAKKGSSKFSSNQCSHSCTPFDLTDAPALVILDTIKTSKQPFLLTMASSGTPTHSLHFEGKTLFFSCLHYLECFLDTVPSHESSAIRQFIPNYKVNLSPFQKGELSVINEMVKYSNSKKLLGTMSNDTLLGISNGFKFVNSSSFLSLLQLEPKFVEEVKDMLVKALSTNINAKAQCNALSSLIEYAKNEVAGPIFSKALPQNILFLHYLELFNQLQSFYALVKNISPSHLNIFNDFHTKIQQLKKEYSTKKTKSSGYLLVQSINIL